MNKVIFIGNRFNVFNEAISLGYNILKTYATLDSPLSHELDIRGMHYDVISSKKQLLNDIRSQPFDLLISNGCPYIIPVSTLANPGQICINIHPSLLPNLKGKHPINGAFLFSQNAGATCHLMDDGIDTGPIISQVTIELTENIDLALLYKMSFDAERDAFLIAHNNNFSPLAMQPHCLNPVYYSRKDEDLLIDFDTPPEQIVRTIKAFGVTSLQARFYYQNSFFHTLDACIVKNAYLLDKSHIYKHREVVYKIDQNVLVKLDNVFVYLKRVSGDMPLINEGDIL